MPIRLIREGILTSERVEQLDAPAEVFYRRLMSKVDDHGLYDARPSILRPSLYPLRVDRVREADITRWIAACEKAGLIALYSHDGKPFLQMLDTRWTARSAPKYPLPSDADCSRMKAAENSCKQEKATAPVFVVGDVVEDDVCAEPPGPALFDEFWKAYPKKRAKDDALKAFTKRKPTRALLDAMLKAIAEQRASPDWLKEKGQFIPYPATWLNDGRWQDVSEPDAPSAMAAPQSAMFEEHSAYLAAEAARKPTASPDRIRAARQAVHAARLGQAGAAPSTTGARDARE